MDRRTFQFYRCCPNYALERVDQHGVGDHARKRQVFYVGLDFFVRVREVDVPMCMIRKIFIQLKIVPDVPAVRRAVLRVETCGTLHLLKACVELQA